MFSHPASASLPAEYEIQRILGSGANGLVYLARNGAGELCALKEFAVSADVAQKFFREASMVFTLLDDHIVRCQNLLYGKGGRSYLVFEYVGGGTLRDHFAERGKLSAAEAIDLLRQLCLGLQHAHEAGILHCDLKPENVLLDVREDGITFKISDLGIARYTAEATETAGISGSPAYMAPEQFYGGCDQRSDIYSLGVIFYEALVGQRPFEGPPARLFTLHSNEQPDLSSVSDEYCLRLLNLLLAKQPSARPAGCAEIVAGIDATLAPSTQLEPMPRRESELRADEGISLIPGGGTFSVELPGATQIFPLFCAGGAQLLVCDGRSSDLFDLQSQRIRPHFLSETTLAAASDPDSDMVLLATQRGMRAYQKGVARWLFPQEIRVVALAHDALRNRIVTATMRRVCCLSFNGTIQWQVEAANYSRPPALLAASTGEVIFSTGPTNPSIRICSSSGELREQIEVHGPVLTLRDEGGDSRFSAVIQGLGADAPTRYSLYSGGVIESSVELGCGIYHAAWHGNLLSIHYTDGRIQLLGQELRPLWEHRCQGVALADAWNSRLRLWLVLERRDGRVWLHSFPLAPACHSAITA